MPVEIKELVIRATIDPAAGADGGRRQRSAGNRAGAAEREAIVSECVEQVMRILRRERER